VTRAHGVTGPLREFLDRPLTSYYLVLGASALLLALGLIMVMSASSIYSLETYHNSYYVFLRQLLWVGIALPMALVAAKLPHRVLRYFSWPAVLIALGLVGLTLSPLGVTVNANTNWIGVGGIQVQPSEFAKLALVLWSADIYARKEALLSDWRHAVVPVIPMALLMTGVVLVGRDLGTALIFLAIIFGMLYVAGAPFKLFLTLITGGGLLVTALAVQNPERMSRLMSFSNPFAYYQDAGWQAAHGILAMSSGGIFGKGISASQQKWGNLPEAHTDFIFAVLGEELGMMGTLLVLALFLVIAYVGLRIAMRSPDPFVRFLSAGITIWLVVQMMVNVGMVLALLPVIGVPLPLVSYGGSSLVPSLVALGLLISMARSEPGAAAALKTRKHRVPLGVNAGSPRRRSR
jgi:cell division protein FtsW